MMIPRRQILVIGLVCFFLSSSVWASSVVQTEFEMRLPSSFQQNLIEQEWKLLQKESLEFSWGLPDQIYETKDVKVVISGVKLGLVSKLQKPIVEVGGDNVVFQSQGLSANLTIQAVSVDQYIEREIGGVIGRFHIQARCEGLHLGLAGDRGVLAARLRPVFENNFLRARVVDVSLDWAPDAWHLGAMNCTGAQGFEDVVKNEILKITGESSWVMKQKSSLIAYVQNHVSQYALDLSKQYELSDIRPDIKTSMSLQSFVAKPEATVVQGVLRVEFLNVKSGDEISLKLSEKSSSESSGGQATIRLPEEFVLAVASQAFAGNSWVQRVSSKRVPGFSSLMKSRLVQFFVWRELMKYSKSAEFQFDIYSPKNVQVKGKGLLYNVQVPLFAKMYAPRNQKYIPFMDFSIPLESKVKLAVSQGKLSAKFTRVNLDLKPYWDRNYLEKYGPARTFASGTIRKRIIKATEGTSQIYNLPKIPVSEGLYLQIDKVLNTNQTGDLIFYLK